MVVWCAPANFSASVFWPFLDREIRSLPFPQQLRRRLEILGPTYIKLGQVMAIREDLLPRAVTRELENLFDRHYISYFSQTTPADDDYNAGRGRAVTASWTMRF